MKRVVERKRRQGISLVVMFLRYAVKWCSCGVGVFVMCSNVICISVSWDVDIYITVFFGFLSVNKVVRRLC